MRLLLINPVGFHATQKYVGNVSRTQSAIKQDRIYVEDAHVPHRVDRQNFVVASSHVRKRSGGRAIFAAIRRASSRKVLEIKCDALGFSTEAG